MSLLSFIGAAGRLTSRGWTAVMADTQPATSGAGAEQVAPDATPANNSLKEAPRWWGEGHADPAIQGITLALEGQTRVERSCSSPFDWSDTLRRDDVASGNAATPPRSPLEPGFLATSPARSQRAWSMSAVPDRRTSFSSTGPIGPVAPGLSDFPGVPAVLPSPPSSLTTPTGAADGLGGHSDDKFLSLRIDMEKVMTGEERRTTVMVRNIPNKYTAPQLRGVLDLICAGGYDYLYLPMDFSSHCNVGYAFVNFSSPEALVAFYRYQDGRRWELHHSDKVCELRFARIQGRDALMLEHQKQFAKHGHRKSRPVVNGRGAVQM